MVLRVILFILLMTKNLLSEASGFDAYSSCYRTSRKRQDLPCDFGSQSWCNIPGNSYPWHAVRRFVHENQGLMRRMYGDERHLSVLRAELESNDIEYFSSPSIKEEFRRRYSKGMDGAKDFVKTFIINEGRKLATDFKTNPAGRVEKVQKSIEEKSNNVIYQNHFATKEEEVKGQAASNKTLQKTSAVPPTTPKTMTVQTTVGASANYEMNATTTEPANTTSFAQTLGDATIQPTTSFPFNQMKSNDTSEEVLDYGSETSEEVPTTTTTTTEDDFTTTDAEFVEEKQKEDYEEVAEEEEIEETVEEPAPAPSQQMIRLKGINACPVKEEVVAPFWANNTRGEVLALLNLYPFEQYVHWEKCTYEHKQMFCREGCRCEQQYRLHRLLAYDPNNECRGIFSDWFRFPSCCVCKCYDLPAEFRLTSRSPRFHTFDFHGKGYPNRYQHQQQQQQQP